MSSSQCCPSHSSPSSPTAPSNAAFLPSLTTRTRPKPPWLQGLSSNALQCKFGVMMLMARDHRMHLCCWDCNASLRPHGWSSSLPGCHRQKAEEYKEMCAAVIDSRDPPLLHSGHGRHREVDVACVDFTSKKQKGITLMTLYGHKICHLMRCKNSLLRLGDHCCTAFRNVSLHGALTSTCTTI